MGLRVVLILLNESQFEDIPVEGKFAWIFPQKVVIKRKVKHNKFIKIDTVDLLSLEWVLKIHAVLFD